MGEIADWMIDQAINQDLKYSEYLSNLEADYWNGEHIWKTKKGERLALQDMTLGHLVNAIKYMRRKENPSNLSKELLRLLEIEFGSRNLDFDIK